MSKPEIKEIEVELVTEEKKELLKFGFDKVISIDLSSSDAKQLKTFFQDLLKNLENEDFTLKFKELEDRGDLFYDVAKEYVSDLATEIESICSQKLNVIELEDELLK